MAVTIISQPAEANVSTISSGFKFEVTSDKTAQENFKYTFRLEINSVPFGTKKVPSTGINTSVDMEVPIRPNVSQFTVFPDGVNLWDVVAPKVNDENPSLINVSIFIGDQYEQGGIIITSELPEVTYPTTRGFSDVVNVFSYASRYRAETVVNPVMLMLRDAPYFTTFNLQQINPESKTIHTLNVFHSFYDKNNALISSGNSEKLIDITVIEQLFVYIPIGTTNASVPIPDNAYRVTYEISSVNNQFPIFIDVHIIDQCKEKPVTLMFKNQYFQFSQFSFNAVNSSQVSKTNDKWENISEGTRDFNIIGREKMQLNTEYITEAEAEELPELFLSDEVYIIPSGEQVIIDQSTLDIKTRRKDKVIQYSFNIEKSKRIFRP